MGSAVCFSPGFSWAEPATVDLRHQIKDQEAKKRAAEQKILESEEKMAMLAEDEASTIQEIERLNVQLNALQGRARTLRANIKQLDKKMALSKEKSRALRREIQVLETYTAKRLVALYKLSRLGTAPILFSGTSLLDIQHRMVSLERILEHDGLTRKILQDKKAGLDVLLKKLNSQKEEHKHLLATCDNENAMIAAKRSERAKLLNKIQTEKSSTQMALLSYRQSVKELDAVVRALRQKAVSTKMTARHGPFFAQKGTLPMPANGELVGFFGAYEKGGPYNMKGFRNGINIKANPGDPVQAIWDGLVIYSDWFKGYGNIVIIDHGAHYYTLSAQLDLVLAKKGDQVKSGDMVGTVGDTATHGGPGLYFEIRHRGKPQNPVPWFGP